MKETDYIRKIMECWTTLDELKGARTKIYFIYRSGTKEKNQFIYQQTFGVNFRYRN